MKPTLESTTPVASSPMTPPPPPKLAPRRSGKRVLWAVIVVVIVLLAFIMMRAQNGRERTGAGNLPIVAAAKVEQEDLAQTLTVAGEFRPYQQVSLHAKVAGYLQSIAVDVGDHVHEGQEIARLDVPELKDDLEKLLASVRVNEQGVGRAEANYTDAHLSWQRLAEVAKQRPKLVAQQDLDTAQSHDAGAAAAVQEAKQRVEESQAEVSKTKAMLAYTAITAPFDGVVTKRLADPGALIQAGTSSSTQAMPLVDIAEDKRLRLTFPVPESAVATIEVGAPVKASVDALGLKLDGKISRFSSKVERATRTMSTEVDIENTDGRLKPGMYATVELALHQAKGAVTVPVQALSSGERPTVLVVGGDGTVAERPVKLGLQTPAKVQVIDGVQPGELVLVGSRSGVQPGQKVTAKIVETAAAN